MEPLPWAEQFQHDRVEPVADASDTADEVPAVAQQTAS
jgi:hypothetical protein